MEGTPTFQGEITPRMYFPKKAGVKDHYVAVLPTGALRVAGCGVACTATRNVP